MRVDVAADFPTLDTAGDDAGDRIDCETIEFRNRRGQRCVIQSRAQYGMERSQLNEMRPAALDIEDETFDQSRQADARTTIGAQPLRVVVDDVRRDGCDQSFFRIEVAPQDRGCNLR